MIYPKRLARRIPMVATIEGRSFHALTWKIRKPYDHTFSKLMIATTSYLLDITDARFGYTQSDEINLFWHDPLSDKQPIDPRRISDINKFLVSSATDYINDHLEEYFRGMIVRNSMSFGSDVFAMSTRNGVISYLVAREMASKENCVRTAHMAEYHYGPRDGINNELNVMINGLLRKGIDWNYYPEPFRRGVCVQKKGDGQEFSIERIVEMPAWSRINNREAVVFDGAKPICYR